MNDERPPACSSFILPRSSFGYGTSAPVTAQIIDGKAVARQIEQEVLAGISRLGFKPGLVAVRVGNDPASEVYVRNKAKRRASSASKAPSWCFRKHCPKASSWPRSTG